MSYESNLKQYLQSTFKSIQRCTLDGAVQKILDGELEAEIDFPLPSEVLSWRLLYACVAKTCTRRAWPQQEGSQLVNLLKSRAEREDIAREFFEPSELPLFYLLENKTSKDVCSFIKKNYIDDKADEAVFPSTLSWNELFNVVKRTTGVRKEYRDALYSVLMFKTRDRKYKNTITDFSFHTCALCWRPVPIRFLGKKEKILCHFHMYRTNKDPHVYGKAYGRALKISHGKYSTLQGGSITFREESNRLRQELQEYFKPRSAEQNEALYRWLPLFEVNPLEAEKTMPWKMQWPHLSEFAPFIPHILDATKENITHSPSMLVSILCPIHPKSNAVEKEQMMVLNKIWEQNYYLFIPELAHAEIWLRFCKFLYNKYHFPA